MGTQTTRATQATTGSTGGNKPNVLFIMADDIGWFNVSALNLGITGYRTPNIDRIDEVAAAFMPKAG